MDLFKLILRNFSYYKRLHIGTILGTAVCTAIITGALIVGDSVRGSLRDIVTDRLGPFDHAIELEHRFFRETLAVKLSRETDTPVSAMLQTDGIALSPGSNSKVRPIRILGIDQSFALSSGNSDIFHQLSDETVLINEQLAGELDLNTGDEILVRFRNISFMPSETPIAGKSDNLFSRRFKISAIIGTGDLGNFSLRINQVSPNNIFISAQVLSGLMDLNGFANTLLFANKKDINTGTLQKSLHKIWKITDAGFDLRLLSNNRAIELSSRGIFFNAGDFSGEDLRQFSPGPVLTYLVSALTAGKRSTPYSFVSAPGAPVVPPSMKDDEIIINSWLAEDLKRSSGDSLILEYLVPAINQKLETRSRRFLIHSVVPLKGIYADRTLMPDFPGISDVDNCRDWDSDLPIDLKKIRRKDENYWDEYGGIPKAFVTISAAQSMWQNRFGNCTSIRYQHGSAEQIQEKLTSATDPERFGFTIIPVKDIGIRATEESVDFSGLFIGLSFFVIIAALLLVSMLYNFSVQIRSKETGLYFALGFSRLMIFKLLTIEGFLLALTGGFIGILLSLFYTQFVLMALKTIWYGAVGTSTLQIHVIPQTILTGFLAGLLSALVTILLVIRRFSKIAVSSLQSGEHMGFGLSHHRRRIEIGVALVLAIIAVLTILLTDPGRSKEAAGSFFLAGFSALLAGIMFIDTLLIGSSGTATNRLRSLFGITLSNIGRRRGRSLTLTGILASSVFIIFTVGANRLNVDERDQENRSGTGGYQFYAETVFPVSGNLNDHEFASLSGLDPGKSPDHFVQLRVAGRDDASCLNLNRVSAPRLIGVDPKEFSRTHRFNFVNYADRNNNTDPWLELENVYPDKVIPGIADETVIIWGLGKSVGDTIIYLDESGNLLKIRLIAGLENSVFQGSILISERNLLTCFPGISGYQIFLAEGGADLADRLSWALQNYGLSLNRAAHRLAIFNRVQNTYLSIFLILGAMGLILGTIGLAVVVTRNIDERRNELAILRVIGFERKTLTVFLLWEHVALISSGFLTGFISAILAVYPAISSGNGETSLTTLIILISMLFTNALLWSWLAVRHALRSDLIAALRNE